MLNFSDTNAIDITWHDITMMEVFVRLDGLCAFGAHLVWVFDVYLKLISNFIIYNVMHFDSFEIVAFDFDSLRTVYTGTDKPV